jgi:hypothetical protein
MLLAHIGPVMNMFASMSFLFINLFIFINNFYKLRTLSCYKVYLSDFQREEFDKLYKLKILMECKTSSIKYSHDNVSI